MNTRFPGLRKALEKNTDILTTEIIPAEDMPRLYSETGFFRFEAFGDLVNEIQVLNYFNIAAANKHMNCALWTKNPWIIKSAIEKFGIEKPENLKIIGSSYYLDKAMTDFYKQYAFIDYVFTVYTADYIRANNTVIGCGGRSCADCGKCYTRTHSGYEINEKLK